MLKMTRISGRNRINGKVMSSLLNMVSWRYLGDAGDFHLKMLGKQIHSSRAQTKTLIQGMNLRIKGILIIIEATGRAEIT